jgi:hypothetical protein
MLVEGVLPGVRLRPAGLRGAEATESLRQVASVAISGIGAILSDV